MLENIAIRNFVLIPSLELDMHDGFSVITGETGSGKSIILGALSLLLGGKADKEEIRSGETSAEVSGVFSTRSKAVLDWLDEKGIVVNDGLIVIRRVVKATGRNHYSINGMAVTVAEGQELGHLLVDISSQHSHQSLMKKETQLSYLDGAAGNDSILESYRKEYGLLRKMESDRAELDEKIRKALEDREYNEFCFRELDNAELEVGEDDRLKEELQLASASEFLVSNLTEMAGLLDRASSQLSDAMGILDKCMRKDPRLSEYAPRLESGEIEVSDILDSIKEHMGSISINEYEIEEKNQRLALLQRLRKKYGGSIERAIERRDELEEKLSYAEESEDMLSGMDRRIEVQKNKVEDIAARLRKNRIKASRKLGKEISEKLNRLGMKDAVFSIEVSAAELTYTGYDRVDFLICPNKGEKISLIEDTASGGELSRIMLAMKSVFSSSNDVETLVFDEIDTGIGGSTAYDVAAELLSISDRLQVLAISHLAQIASKASQHLMVSKKVVNGRTISTLTEIRGEERVREIARLLSGDASDISLEHAEKLLEVESVEHLPGELF